MCQLTQSEDVHGDDMQVDLICTEPAQISRNDKVPKAVTYCRYLDPHATALRSLGVVVTICHNFFFAANPSDHLFSRMLDKSPVGLARGWLVDYRLAVEDLARFGNARETHHRPTSLDNRVPSPDPWYAGRSMITKTIASLLTEPLSI